MLGTVNICDFSTITAKPGLEGPSCHRGHHGSAINTKGQSCPSVAFESKSLASCCPGVGGGIRKAVTEGGDMFTAYTGCGPERPSAPQLLE